MMRDIIDAFCDWVFWLEVLAYFATLGLFTAAVLFGAGLLTGTIR